MLGLSSGSICWSVHMSEVSLNSIPIASLFHITQRYLRSTNLERDFQDSKALENYVLTPHAQECLVRLAKGLHPTSTQRAWRLTGNYGSGKSSFALFLAHWFAGNATKLSKALQVDVRYNRFSIASRPSYLPLLVTGTREPMGKALLRALCTQFGAQYSRGMKSSLQQRIASASARKRVGDTEVVELIQAANEKLVKDGKSTGLLIILDELGKFLEYAAYHPESQDVYLLQKLAEVAATSGRSAPLFVVGMLHQGFDAYAQNLDPLAQREWEKIAGRFEEVLFNQPVLQVAELIGAALRVRASELPTFAWEEARSGLEAAVDLGWVTHTAGQADLATLAARIYPIHGTVLSPLVRTFSRFGQNERSLFGFLFSGEPFSLARFAERAVAQGACYRLHDFYDYIRANFGHRLSMQSYRSHWPQIESMVESFATSDPVELAVVKAVGVLNLLDHPDLAPTEEAIVACLSGPGGFTPAEVEDGIARLHKMRHVLFRTGISKALRLWSHTNVDLESAYERAAKAIGTVPSVTRALEEFLETRPLVARRHYIETGSLRYFDVRYVPADRIAEAAEAATTADGAIVVALCETKADCAAAEEVARSERFRARKELLIAIPIEPLVNQAGLVAEAQRWNWVAVNTPELHVDRLAREEVFRQREGARQRLVNRVQDLIGLRSLNGARALKWYFVSESQKILSGRHLLERLSALCDELYPLAPRVKNELLNRHNISSAAAGARSRLIASILSESAHAWLGMDSTKRPPEMSMYLSVLKRGNLHVESRDRWCLQVPERRNDPLRVAPCLNAIERYFEKRPDVRIKASEILEMLSRPPFGIRSGLALVLLAVYGTLNIREIAFYEDGTFLRKTSGDEFLRLCKAPSSFELQLCRISGVRAEVFETLLRALGLRASKTQEPLVLEVVKPLCSFVASLPEYARVTGRLAPPVLGVRDAILAAREPVTLLFRELPVACGVEPFSVDGPVSAKHADVFSRQLKACLDDLQGAFAALLDRMRERVRTEFDLDGSFEKVRAKLVSRARAVMLLATEPRVKGLCLRLADEDLAEAAWLESLGSFLCMQPPAFWKDAQEDMFAREIHTLAGRFRGLESIAFADVRPTDIVEAFHLSLTKNDGSETQQVVFVEKEQLADVNFLAGQIEELVSRNRAVGLAALSRVAWSTFKKDSERP